MLKAWPSTGTQRQVTLAHWGPHTLLHVPKALIYLAAIYQQRQGKQSYSCLRAGFYMHIVVREKLELHVFTRTMRDLALDFNVPVQDTSGRHVDSKTSGQKNFSPCRKSSKF